MGQPKALLPIQPGGTFLGRILGTVSDAAFDPLIVVARGQFDVAAAWDDARATNVIVVINPEPDRGQLSSLVCGLDARAAPPPGILMTLVDVPLPRADTVRALVEAWHHSHAPFVRPVHQGQHGHPVILGAEVLARLRATDPGEGAKPVIRAFEDRGVTVAVDDPGV